MGVLRGRGIVFPLVEESACLLSFESLVMESDAIHRDNRGCFFPLEKSGRTRWEVLKFADTRVDTLDDGCGMKLPGQLCHEGLAGEVGVHRLGQDLDGEHVVIAVDDQTW